MRHEHQKTINSKKLALLYSKAIIYDGVLDSLKSLKNYESNEENYKALTEKGVIIEYKTMNSGQQKRRNEDWINSDYFGFISSRIYLGQDGVLDIDQDFSYKAEPRS